MATDRMIAHVVGVEDLTVIRNLETAFEEETKTSTAYKAYAARADEEGFSGLASLFRATALAEQIHAGNHGRVLRHMGGSPRIDVPMPRIEGSFENLRTALVDQKFEVDYLYPAFLTAAVPLFDSTAIRSFHWALEADKSHVQLYGEIMARINGGGSRAGNMRNMHSLSAGCADMQRNIQMEITAQDAIIYGKNLKR